MTRKLGNKTYTVHGGWMERESQKQSAKTFFSF